MICTQCQAPSSAGDTFCGNCGNRLSSADTRDVISQSGIPDSQTPYQRLAEESAGQSAPAGSHGHAATRNSESFSPNLRRLSQVELLVGGASVVTLISLFLPWFGYSTDGVGFSISGVTAHGYLYLALIVALALIAYLVLRAGWDQLPVTLPIAQGPLLLIGTGLQFLLVLVGFLDKPLGLLSWDIGAYLGLIAAAAAAGPVLVPAIRSFQASR